MSKALHKDKFGFTIIEILVILIIIGILLALIFTTYAGIRDKERNTTRQNDINALQEKLELYYTENLRYPTLADMNNISWVKENMSTLNIAYLQDPSSNSYALATKPTPHEFAYIVTANNGAACNNTTVTCQEYTLTATLEGGGTYTKASLN